jgi:ketosteroid isomerase-like protein
LTLAVAGRTMPTVRTVTTGHTAPAVPSEDKGNTMATELTGIVKELFNDLDRADFDAIVDRAATEVQTVEEITRRWMRNCDELTDYFAQLGPLASDFKSQLSDVHEVSWGDTGLVTCWLEQSYVLAGEEHYVSAPTTFVFRREGGDWKVVLMHSVPLPEGD